MLGSRSFYCIFDTTGEVFQFQDKHQRDQMLKHGCREIRTPEVYRYYKSEHGIQKVSYHEFKKFKEHFITSHTYIQMTIWDLLD